MSFDYILQALISRDDRYNYYCIVGYIFAFSLIYRRFKRSEKYKIQLEKEKKSRLLPIFIYLFSISDSKRPFWNFPHQDSSAKTYWSIDTAFILDGKRHSNAKAYWPTHMRRSINYKKKNAIVIKSPFSADIGWLNSLLKV